MNLSDKVSSIGSYKVIPMANTNELFIFRWFDGRATSDEYIIIKRKDFPNIKDIRDFENLPIDRIWFEINRDYDIGTIYDDIASRIEIVEGFW